MVKKRKASEKSSCCSKFFSVMLILGIIVFVLQAIIAFGNFSQTIRGLWGNSFIVAISLITFIASFMIYRRIASNFPREKKAKLSLSISIFLFSLGDVLWLFDENFKGILTPVGSIPDAFWFVGYISLIISLIYFINISFRPSKLITLWIILAGIIIGGTILGLDVGEDLEAGSFTLAHLVQDMYILFDLIVIFLVVYLVWPVLLTATRYAVHWIVLAIGLIIRLVYDLFFANMTQAGTYYTGHPLDLLYTSLYIFLLLHFYIKSKMIGVIQ